MVLGMPKTALDRTETPSSSRRRFLKAGGVAAASGLAGCTSVLGGSSLDTLSIAYKPIFPFLQYLVMDERGYLSDIGPDV
ncbi:MAG: NitT/TauT family transport system substrate-binding protein, partial [Haloarculaceae archaeon]